MGTGTDMAVTVQGVHKAYVTSSRSIGTYVPVTPASGLLRGPWRGSGWHLTATAAMATIMTVSLLIAVWRLRQE